MALKNIEQAMKKGFSLRRLVLWGNTLLLISMAVGVGVLCLGCGWLWIGHDPFTAFLVLPFLLCYLPGRRRAEVWVQVLTLAPLLLMVGTNVYTILTGNGDDAPLGWAIMQVVFAVATLGGHLLLRAALLMYRKWCNRPAKAPSASNTPEP